MQWKTAKLITILEEETQVIDDEQKVENVKEHQTQIRNKFFLDFKPRKKEFDLNEKEDIIFLSEVKE